VRNVLLCDTAVSPIINYSGKDSGDRASPQLLHFTKRVLSLQKKWTFSPKSHARRILAVSGIGINQTKKGEHFH